MRTEPIGPCPPAAAPPAPRRPPLPPVRGHCEQASACILVPKPTAFARSSSENVISVASPPCPTGAPAVRQRVTSWRASWPKSGAARARWQFWGLYSTACTCTLASSYSHSCSWSHKTALRAHTASNRGMPSTRVVAVALCALVCLVTAGAIRGEQGLGRDLMQRGCEGCEGCCLVATGAVALHGTSSAAVTELPTCASLLPSH